ncbi:hypothetical protein ES288_D02G122300v1 [Gossypium darwinii]|uniref:Uncharacterized protein n=1 Tax=Gossypium darwinii TaxID=34276 RepID=A0A5D2DG07_GOSDA|nr:hypothetical protein ES288_D02G122300v1 [Gossypium darwinii]
MKGDLLLVDVNIQLKSRNVTANIKVDTSSNVNTSSASSVVHYVYRLFTTIIVDEPVPGLKAIFDFRVPDQRSGKYLHECARISSSIGLTDNLIVNFLGVLGTNVLALGTDISFDTKTGNFTKRNVGLSFNNPDLIASLALHVVMNEKGDPVNSSYYHIVNPSTNIGVGVEVTHSFFTNVNTITVGTQHALDPLTTIKARVNNIDNASALIQHEEVDTKSIDKSPKVRLALALKP